MTRRDAIYSEDDLIQLLTAQGYTTDQVVVGVGDDTAVLSTSDPDAYLLFTQDSMVANIHFTHNDDPRQIGWKALARNLSDIAAMGGRPAAAVVALGITDAISSNWLKRVYDGMYECAAQFSCPVVGGDISRTRHDFFMSISMIGTVERNAVALRSGASAGDLLCVTGELGGSLLGKHLSFRPRIGEAAWLIKKLPVTAMIDVSDGLGKDIYHLCTRSGVGCEIDAQSLPISDAARIMAQKDGKTELCHALHDGEDFELLFTIDAADRKLVQTLLSDFNNHFGIPITIIGRMTDQLGKVMLRRHDGSVELLEKGGFDHLCKKD